ncbi:autotransporter assembly complex protein TamA [Pseudodonghicola xiamenensis]|uniref:Outer membrane protein assembly factor n=1 Tax=Pseudodonghicola xiamenensis TaxID=337702 RepID=A0A8J3H9J4_9RHOB|nr:BamA/TamA family outer membrane protein [Pseudodonghicola xiamenensis]GHG93573.1 outer membrane protein assembly factor [Pseudodonghicola xiamenensis]
MTGNHRKDAVLRGLRTALVVASLSLPQAALAFDTALNAPKASKDLQTMLSDSSAVIAAKERKTISVQELVAAAQADYSTLVQVLYDQGYFSPVIHIRLDGQEAAYLDPLRLPREIKKIAIDVDPGDLFHFGQAEVTPLAPGTKLPEGFATGQVATTGAISEAAAVGVQGWRDAGYAKTKVGSQRIVANHLANRLDAEVRLAPGQQLRFGKLIVTGTSTVKETSVQRIAGLPQGDTYSPATLQKVSSRLRRTGTFETVALKEADKANPDGTLDIVATLEDQPKRRISLGAELSSRAGMDLSAAWTHRNLFHGAERLRIETAIRNIGGTEDIDGRIGIRLDRPDRLGPDDSIFYTFDLERLDRTHYSVNMVDFGIGMRRVFSPRLYGEISVTANSSTADDAFGSGRDFQYLALPVKLEWDRRDNPVNARGGEYLNLETMAFAGFSGSESGLRLKVDGRAYRSFGSTGRITLAGRLQVGSVIGPAQDKVSPDLLFFSGGAGTVRGQPYDSLGIELPSGLMAGGRSFVGASVELRGMITDKISAVGFFDYGAVDADAFIGSNSPSHSGAGVGVRYDLGGFGPIRLDLALPVNGGTGDGLQFYIGIGQAF